MLIKINIPNLIDYILVFLLISLSGNKVFGMKMLLFAFFLSLFLFLYRKKPLDLLFLYFMLALTLILLLQALKFDYLPLVTIFGLYVTILSAYFIVKGVGQTFVEKYVNIVLIISFISIGFFLILNIVPGLAEYLTSFALHEGPKSIDGNNRYYLGIITIIISKYQSFDFLRNHGPFWESGAFGGYVLVALIFNIMRTGQMINRKNIIFIVTIFSTVSTTALVALMALSFFYLLSSSRLKLLKVVMLPAVSILGIFLFTYFDFLGTKIEQKIKLAQNPTVIYTTTSSRFVDAVRDLNALEGHEIIGRGINLQTRLSEIDKRTGYIIRTNGLTDHLVRFGGIFFIITFIFMYFSFCAVNNYYQRLNNLFAIYTIFIVILILQSETYFIYPFFWGLLFLYSGYNENEKRD